MEPATGLDPVGRPEAMEWYENNEISYVFGLANTTAPGALVRAQSEAVEADWAPSGTDIKAVRGHAEARYAAGT